MLTAIDRYGGACNEACIVCHKEYDRAGDILGASQSANRNAFDDFLKDILRHGTNHVGVYIARSNCVNGDPLSRTFLCKSFSETMDTRLGCRIVHLAVLAGLTVYRTHINDAAKTSLSHTIYDQSAHVEARAKVSIDNRLPLFMSHPMPVSYTHLTLPTTPYV